jgi:hypothetical protein
MNPATHALYVSLLACALGYACTTQPAKTSITVPDPTALDASLRDSGGLRDASSDAASLGPHIRGPTPEWPDAEQEVELPYRGEAAAAEVLLAPNQSRLDMDFKLENSRSFAREIEAKQTDH